MTVRILVTGASGGIGSFLRPRLAREDRVLRLLDHAASTPGEREEVVEADVTDPGAVLAAMADVDAVIHLAGYSLEEPWRDILEVNIHGTQVVLDAARRAGVRRVVLASSNHAVGFQPTADVVPDDVFPRPDTFYGVGKVAMEALGSLYHDAYGMDVICVRIGTCFEPPRNTRDLFLWLSPDDCGRLFDACLTAPSPGFRVVWGVSDNTRRQVSLEAARSLGYEPKDDSEAYARMLIARDGEPDRSASPHDRLGGAWLPHGS